MQTTANRLARLVASAAVLALPLAACGALGGGGGTAETDCENDVAGSAVDAQATADFGENGESCNNNATFDTDHDAYAYPASDDDDLVFAFCNEDDATFSLYDVTSGFPVLVDSGPCDNNNHESPNTEDTRYVLVIEHGANSEATDFTLQTFND